MNVNGATNTKKALVAGWDPYAWEINEVKEESYMCDECCSGRADEI